MEEKKLVKTIEEIERETAAADLRIKQLALAEKEAIVADLQHRAEMRDLEKKEREANLVDLKERLDERQLKRKTQGDVFRGHGANLKQDAIVLAEKQKRCNHHKGGDGAQGVLGGQGDDMQYCIIRHVMGNGDIWVRCLRCAKTWKPPVLSQFVDDPKGYATAMALYEAALSYPTRNKTSGTHTFQWQVVTNSKGQKEGGPEFYREKMKDVTLA